MGSPSMELATTVATPWNLLEMQTGAGGGNSVVLVLFLLRNSHTFKVKASVVVSIVPELGNHHH